MQIGMEIREYPVQGKNSSPSFSPFFHFGEISEEFRRKMDNALESHLSFSAHYLHL